MTDEKSNGNSTSVFISYSRKDKLFVRKLNDALEAAGINAWVDWEGIPLSSDWMAEITPESVSSRNCAQELGLSLNKKLVPILYREPEKGAKMHDKLGATNWLCLQTQKDDFRATIPKLIDAIQTDLTWVRQYMRLLEPQTGDQTTAHPDDRRSSGIRGQRHDAIESADLMDVACSRLTINMSEINWAIFFPSEPYQRLCTDLLAGQ